MQDSMTSLISHIMHTGQGLLRGPYYAPKGGSRLPIVKELGR